MFSQQAEMIVSNAQSVGLDVAISNITPGDGNCWYHAVRDQLNRVDLRHLFPQALLNFDHQQLRQFVLEFILKFSLTSDLIKEYKNALYGDDMQGWLDYLINQGQIGVWAESLY